MAGAFVRTRYECDDGTIALMRLQPETLAATVDGTANASATGTVTAKARVRARKGAREYGTAARLITIAWTAAPPDGYKPGATLTIPIMQPAVFNGISLLDAGTYQGAAMEVIGKDAEDVD